MAGTVERQALKRAAALALDDSRLALGRELTRVRTEWNPRELVKHSLEKHKVALMATAAVAGFIAVKLLMPRDPGRAKSRSWTGRLLGVASTAFLPLLRNPIVDYAKSHFASYLEKFQRQQPPPDSK